MTDPVLIGDYPREDVRLPHHHKQHGTVEVFLPGEEEPRLTFRLREYGLERLDAPVGSVFTVRVQAGDGDEEYERTFTFRASGNEDDVGHYTVGPGLQVVKHHTFRRDEVSGFEFGATVMGAVLDG